jgi:glycosyltransferase involved in cell wall biosynthesis
LEQTASGQAVLSNHRTLQALVGLVEDRISRGKVTQALTAARIAAMFGSYNHPGEFVSPRLEAVLASIGVDDVSHSNQRRVPRSAIRRTLHVLTAAKEIGGDSRFVWRWLTLDHSRQHDVALTAQGQHRVPEALQSAVRRCGGSVHLLGEADLTARAAALRRLATKVDVVFLHVYVEDILPVIAFANAAGLPPIILVVQADHQFWVGRNAADGFLHLRAEGQQLSAARRAIPNAMMLSELPVPLVENAQEEWSRGEARLSIGAAGASTVLLSIARPIKYKPIAGSDYPGFVDSAVSVLQKHPDAMMFVVGPESQGEWEDGRRATAGRLIAVGSTSDTERFYRAADVYVDSFPFASNTSLLEAASRGLPIISYTPYAGTSAVLGPGAPGIDKDLRRCRSLETYLCELSRLIADPVARKLLGAQTRAAVQALHTGGGWETGLERVYSEACALPEVRPAALLKDFCQIDDVDVLLHDYNSRHFPLSWIIEFCAKSLPYRDRVELLSRLWRIDQLFSLGLFLPHWAAQLCSGRFSGWRSTVRGFNVVRPARSS